MRQGACPPPYGPLVAPPTYFFLLCIPAYPENSQEHHETLFLPPQPSVPVRSHLGAFFGALPEGESITEGFYINTIYCLLAFLLLLFIIKIPKILSYHLYQMSLSK